MIDKETRDEINKYLLGIKSKDKDYLNLLYDLIAPSIRYIALKYLKNEDDADDLVQDFWANIYKIANGFIIPYNGFGYVCKVMNRMAINRYNKIHNEMIKKIEFVDYRDLHCDDSSVNWERFAINKIIDDAILKLSETERIIIQLTFFEDITVRAIAKKLKLSKSYVSKLKLLALDKLKSELKKELEDKNNG